MAYMSYTTNPYLPRLRMQAARKVLYESWGVRQVARYYGVSPGAISKWVQKARLLNGYTRQIPTNSPRPNHHPSELKQDIIDRIVGIRNERGRCAEIVHRQTLKENQIVSLSSVKRTLDRQGLIKKRSPWKKYHEYTQRPEVASVGDLVEIDTVHFFNYDGVTKFYVYTLLDVYSRWAWAVAVARMNTYTTIQFVKEAQKNAPFVFQQLQTDHGSEFSTFFSGNVGIPHRHIHLRSPNENGHLERFNRTIQEECLQKTRRTVSDYQKAILDYLPYYNTERMHLGINFQTPIELTKCFQAIE